MTKVSVNLALCYGHARCEDICPEVFTTDTDEGKCVILSEVVPDHLLEKVELAVLNCPEQALRLSDEDAAGAS